ncbi:hypothetical protein EYF80_051368 [Liparis tanakae]|uniref:Uncharacterized protein n=1 Tax=Liparis tanakae TaxID=230148 RepID=A0A4Z2FB44_9TELE|nr:hypothetical protein EYF80_051368 [Liparis tanakae]
MEIYVFVAKARMLCMQRSGLSRATLGHVEVQRSLTAVTTSCSSSSSRSVSLVEARTGISTTSVSTEDTRE